MLSFRHCIMASLSILSCHAWAEASFDSYSHSAPANTAAPTSMLSHSMGFKDFFSPISKAMPLTKIDGLNLSDLPTARSAFGTIHNFLRDHGLNPQIGLKHTYQGSFQTEQEYIGNMSFHVGSVEFCHDRIRLVQDSNGTTTITGSMPQLAHVQMTSDEDWPRMQETISRLIENPSIPKFVQSDIRSIKKCYLVNQGQLIPTWKLVVQIASFNQTFIASEQSLFVHYTNGYDLSPARIETYDRSPASASTIWQQTDMADNGLLSNDSFVSSNRPSQDRYQSASGDFPLHSDENYRAEASMYANANAHLDFMKSIGAVWTPSKPIVLVPNFKFRLNVQNAKYEPAQENDPASIYVSAGATGDLENLTVDADVVSHEIGHHIVYQSVQAWWGESVEIHEALSDFLNIIRTQDPCIGTSVCANSNATSCRIFKNACLRSANNNFAYNDDFYRTYPTKPHLRSLMLSGFLWDLWSHESASKDYITSIIVDALKYLPWSAMHGDLIAAIIESDAAKGGHMKSIILQTAIARGLDPSSLSLTNSSNTSPSSYQEERTKKGEIERALGCASLGIQSEGNSTERKKALWALIALLPLMVLLFGHIKASFLSRKDH